MEVIHNHTDSNQFPSDESVHLQKLVEQKLPLRKINEYFL